MRRLVELPDARVRWLGPAGQAPDAAFGRLRPLLAALGPHHAGLLAQPVKTAAGIAWDAPGTAHRTMPSLDRGQRQVFDATLTRLLSDIRRAAETARAEGRAEDAELLDLVRRVPAPELVFALDGAPVLAGWGMAAGDGPAISVLTPFDDGVAAAPLVGDRKALWMAGLAVLALAIAAILAAPFIKQLVSPPLPACVVDERGLASLAELEALREQGRALAAERDRLRTERGRRQLDCPLPEPPPPPAPPPAPAPEPPPPEPPRQEPPPAPPPPPPPPPPRAELPQDRWNRGDLSMLEGCWNLDSNYSIRDVTNGQDYGVRSWRMCFDANGRGRQTMVFGNGLRCEAPVIGRFEGRQLLLDDTADVPCEPNFRVFHRLSRCDRDGDNRAQCVSRAVPPRTGGANFTLRR